MNIFPNIVLISCFTIGEGSPAEPVLHVAIIWRRDHNHIKYEWLPRTWSGAKSHEWNETRDHLESTIQRLLRASGALSYEAVIKVRFIVFISVLIAEYYQQACCAKRVILLIATYRSCDVWASFVVVNSVLRL